MSLDKELRDIASVQTVAKKSKSKIPSVHIAVLTLVSPSDANIATLFMIAHCRNVRIVERKTSEASAASIRKILNTPNGVLKICQQIMIK
jgi:hypothetical protein